MLKPRMTIVKVLGGFFLVLLVAYLLYFEYVKKGVGEVVDLSVPEDDVKGHAQRLFRIYEFEEYYKVHWRSAMLAGLGTGAVLFMLGKCKCFSEIPGAWQVIITGVTLTILWLTLSNLNAYHQASNDVRAAAMDSFIYLSER